MHPFSFNRNLFAGAALDSVNNILKFISKHYPEQLQAAADGMERVSATSPRRSPRTTGPIAAAEVFTARKRKHDP